MKNSYIYIAEGDRLETFIYALKIRQRDFDVLPEMLGISFQADENTLFDWCFFSFCF